ncbi:tRNA lysidine(34) synthetase TilS [Pseudomaricurvus sp.]|uniref:tRNA lysidine(34) synthetase TilS n=1 Tax=Pseudomaricurvus sp. TaxID=2004510 RepID=UPI003F6B1B58
MPSVSDIVQKFVTAHPEVKRWWVAYSGGLDSAVLLKGLVSVGPPQPVVALHVNHGLSDHAEEWQSHCQKQCDDLGVELVVERVRVKADGRGLEDAARQARYEAFERHLASGDALLLAHHQDDQAETLLLRLMRGSGPKGMSAMTDQRSVAKGVLYRPLLGVSRTTLEEQARQWSLSWVEDDSNSSLSFDRNYLRHQVLPAVRERWPDFAEQWQQSAGLCRQSEELVQEVATEDWLRMEWRPERLGSSISLTALKALSSFRRGNLLRYWLEQQGLPLPERVHLQEVEHQLIEGREDSSAEVEWGGVRLRRSRQRLFLLQEDKISSAPVPAQLWDGRAPLQWGGWSLSLESVEQGGFRLPAQGFQVSARLGGERCHPSWRDRSQTLKKLLQEADIEPWLRSKLPLLWVNGEIAVVADLWHCKGWEADSEPGYRLIWRSLDGVE